MEKHFGCSRFVFNWALALQKRYYAIFGKSLSRTKIQSHLVKKKKKARFAWLFSRLECRYNLALFVFSINYQ